MRRGAARSAEAAQSATVRSIYQRKLASYRPWNAVERPHVGSMGSGGGVCPPLEAPGGAQPVKFEVTPMDVSLENDDI